MGVALAGTCGALVALGLIVAAGGFAKPKPPSIAAQVTDIRKAAARQGGAMVYTLSSERLNGTQERSYVFVLRRQNHGSDEVRIYDDVDGRLRLRFDFRPRTGDAWISLDTTAAVQQRRAPVAYWMTHRPIVADVNGDGTRELLLAYRAGAISALAFRIPLSVAWDDRRQEYVLSAVLRSRPPERNPDTIMPAFRRAFMIRNAIHPGRSPLRAYAVSELLLLRDGVLATVTEAGLPGGRLPPTVGYIRVTFNLFQLFTDHGAVQAGLLCQPPKGRRRRGY